MRRDDPEEEVVSPLNRVAVGLWLLAIPAVGIAIRYADLRDGSASVPPLASGLFVLALLVDGWEFSSPGPYFRISGGELRIGRRVRITREEIDHVRVEVNWLGLRRICITCINGRRWGQKAYLFARPSDEIAACLQHWASPAER